jgi:magnesium-transporting ATPase (P-type)
VCHAAAVFNLQRGRQGQGTPITITVLIALLVCLIPTTIGGLLSAIGIAGMDRMIQRNVIAMSGRAVEAAGDVDVLLLDKTGTITLGNRQAVEFIPSTASTQKIWPKPRNSLPLPMKLPKVVPSLCLPKKNLVCADKRWAPAKKLRTECSSSPSPRKPA